MITRRLTLDLQSHTTTKARTWMMRFATCQQWRIWRMHVRMWRSCTSLQTPPAYGPGSHYTLQSLSSLSCDEIHLRQNQQGKLDLWMPWRNLWSRTPSNSSLKLGMMCLCSIKNIVKDTVAMAQAPGRWARNWRGSSLSQGTLDGTRTTRITPATR